MAGLSPRQRVPVLLADPSVASRRLVGIGVPESFGSPRKIDLVASGAMAQLRATLEADPTVAATVRNLHGRYFTDVLADTLREHALLPSRVIDPYPAVVRRAQRLGRRALIAGAVVLVLLATGFVVAVQASQPTKETSAAALASRSASCVAGAHRTIADVHRQPFPAGAVRSCSGYRRAGARGALGDERHSGQRRRADLAS